ncbi:MAG: hypothetical protein MK098_01260 [Marinovum sp.]|nr:hypothetical protein [Marinovum sp.]
MNQQLYNFMTTSGQGSGNPCEEGTVTFEGERVICTFADTASIAEALESAAQEQARSQGPELDPLSDIGLVEVGPRTLALTLPLDPEGGDDASAAEMINPFREQLQGETFEYVVVAKEIVSTNGVISDDGTTATLVVNVIDILEPTSDTPKLFEATFKY